MHASVVGAVGTALGALGAVAGGWVSVIGQGRQRNRQLHADREHRCEAARREAYGALIASTKLLSAAWWRFSGVVWNEQSTPEQWRASLGEAAHEAWTRFSTAVAGPVSAADAADELRLAMYGWEKTGMDWFAAALREGHGQLPDCYERFKQAWQEKRCSRKVCRQPRVGHTRRRTRTRTTTRRPSTDTSATVRR
ncbi:hypothetical protein ACFWWC_44450 [Streptomyces sp. NPDC058642]|uniref:hypothetical protein n=1 Tax=Streptomyces sp. NPDC058642 TaxID=3346572 RepID=UPI00364CC502